MIEQRAGARVHVGPDVGDRILAGFDAFAECFKQLKSLVADVELTQATLDEAIGEAEAEAPKGVAIATAWQKAKVWIEAALTNTFWAAKKATKVRELVDRIQGLFSSVP